MQLVIKGVYIIFDGEDTSETTPKYQQSIFITHEGSISRDQNNKIAIIGKFCVINEQKCN